MSAKQLAAQCRVMFIFYTIFVPSLLRAESQIRFLLDREKRQVDVRDGDQRIALYCFGDTKTRRPYFAHLYAPGGIRVSRNFPPIEGEDFTDHALMHPGLWMAFGDLGGTDSWRLHATIEQLRFDEKPTSEGARGTFTIINAHHSSDSSSEVLATDTTRFDFIKTKFGYLIGWDTTFSSDRAFYFGDQEELGIGVRVASPLRVQDGRGRILDSSGRKNEEGVWGKSAKWCDYSGPITNKWAGITLYCHPGNFRNSWLHARNYGFMAANPFGRKSFGHGTQSKVCIEPGEKLRLRYGILLHAHSSADELDLQESYSEYLRTTKQ